MYSEVPAQVAGLFTTNRIKAAPVLATRRRVRKGICQAVIVNSGNANACTGEQGLRDAEAMARFGMHLGTAFQLIDDALDYGSSGEDIGKNIGDDLAEGKPTLPLIHAMRNGTPEQVREDVKRNVAALAPGGGYVFNTVHNIQADVPPENIMAMWETLQEYAPYPRDSAPWA